MKETRKQKIDRQRGHAADRAFDPIRAAMDSGDLVITPSMSDSHPPVSAHEGDCNPFVAQCGAKFCTFEEARAHDLTCSAVTEGAPPQTLEVIVNGMPVVVQAGPIREVIESAVRQAGQVGAPVDQWVLRTRDGEIIPHDLPGGVEWALSGGQQLWLHLGLPIAGAAARQEPPEPAMSAEEAENIAGERMADVLNLQHLREDKAALEAELAALRAQLDGYQNREAACCPEDVGFEEVIAALRAERDKAERVFQAVVYAFEGREVPADLHTHGFVNRGRKHHAALVERAEAAERERDAYKAEKAALVERLEQAPRASGSDIHARVVMGGLHEGIGMARFTLYVEWSDVRAALDAAKGAK